MEPCALCGDHDAITEYFEDELFYYCPKYDRTVSDTEIGQGILDQELIALEASDLSLDNSNSIV